MTWRCPYCGKESDEGDRMMALVIAAAFGGMIVYGTLQLLFLIF